MRCKAIEKDHGVKMHRTTLGNFYREHNVRKMPPFKKMNNPKTKLEMDIRKLTFLVDLAAHMKKGSNFYWFDETSVSLWSISTKLWQPKDNPIEVNLPPRGSGVTVIGAIGKGRLHYSIAESTNKE